MKLDEKRRTEENNMETNDDDDDDNLNIVISDTKILKSDKK